MEARQMKSVDRNEDESPQTRLQIDGAHAELIFDRPGKKPNVLSRNVFQELRDHFAILRSKTEIKTLLIYSAKPEVFLAGADISEIQAMKTREDAETIVQGLHDLFNELEALPQVTVAAISGACMGGGTELALSCKFRVASDSSKTQIGLPEIKLGVLPGAGGTQRLPRLISLVDAITMITSGAPVVAKKALKMGLVDDLIPAETMVEIARKKLRAGEFRRTPRAMGLTESFMSSALGRMIVFKKSRAKILEATKGDYPAPLKALEVIEKTYGGDFKEGCKAEIAAFVELALTPISKNLIHIFFTSEELKKERGVQAHEVPEIKPKKYESIGVIGAGIMGGGISAVAARKGIRVRLKDVAHESILTALKESSRLFKKDFERKKIERAEFEKLKYRIASSLDWTGFEHIPFVIEAVVEKMEVKKQVISELERCLSENAIIATNTSSLSVSEMAKASKRPDRIVGMHFFNPVPAMPLVEVIRADQTSAETVLHTVALGKQLGKTVIVVKDRPGFLVNRILMPFLNECSHLRAEGYSIEQIDEAAIKFGMPMGPFRLLDEVGLDTGAKVADVIAAGFPYMKVLPTIHEMVEKGYLGKKNGKGFYQYDTKGKAVGVRTEFQSAAMGPGESTLRSLQDRLILPMVAESIMALDEGIVSSVRDLDLALIFGIGFPAFRGGILKYVSQTGERDILDRLNVIHNATKGRIVVPKSLTQRVHAEQKFYI